MSEQAPQQPTQEEWPRNWRHWPRNAQHPTWEHGVPPWARDWPHHRRSFFWRFALAFGFMILLTAGIISFITWHFAPNVGTHDYNGPPFWIGLRCLALSIPFLAIRFGLRAFRSVATPLANIMEAADAVADGNLNVQVQERGSREFRQLARSFNRMTEELARTDQQRRNLTADVAHELRTPLHIIQGNLEGVLDGVYQPTREHIEATLEETRLLVRLVDDLRTLSLTESGQLPLRDEQVDACDLLADVATSFSGQAEGAGIELRVAGGAWQAARDLGARGREQGAGDTEMPRLVVRGDAGRLDQVLSNLVANALRHTPRGGTITLAAAGIGDRVQIQVSDTGEGIAAADLPFIFDRFWRADRARTHSSGSTGLGLAIASQLVKAHGGDIRVASELGKGTTFTVDLPASNLQMLSQSDSINL
ncbi:MAG: HAMP domain-containing sensor histidine kinase [Caldilineaceae bacterium]